MNEREHGLKDETDSRLSGPRPSQTARSRRNGTRRRTLVTVSGEISLDYEEAFAAGERPKPDYLAIAEAADADLLDRRIVRSNASRATRLVERLVGINAAMAVHAFRTRRNYAVILTDGEQVGLPLALLMKLVPRRRVRHVMIVHRISAPKKRAMIKLLRLSSGVDELLVYSTSQLMAAQDLFSRPGQRVSHIDFMVDCDFFHQQGDQAFTGGRPLVVSAGREFRDYPTLIEAVAKLDVDVVVASASPWSKREDNAHDVAIPENVTVTELTHRELRETLNRAALVVVPLQAVDFQAGITTILEAMAMSLPVVCTATVGQIDVVVDGVTGCYVGPGDVGAMRRVILELLSDPDRRNEMGKAGRRLVEERADVSFYAKTIAARLADQQVGLENGEPGGQHRSNEVDRRSVS